MAAERREAEVRRAPRREAQASREPDRPAAVRSKRLSNWEERELAELPEKIEVAEQELVELDARLADPSIYTGDASAAQQLTASRAEVQQKVDALLARWEELETRASSP
jgi:ATP-binding cassette subfamily F protein uup